MLTCNAPAYTIEPYLTQYMKGIVIKSDGTIVKHQMWKFDLKFLQEVVGGNIQLVTTQDGKDMIINEDGIAKDLPLNAIASKILHKDYREDPAVMMAVLGDVFVFLKGKLK